MVFPLLIDDAQHQHALVIAHLVGADLALLRLVTFFQLIKGGVAQFLAIEFVDLHAFRDDVHAEAGEDFFLQAVGVPGIGVRVLRDVLRHQLAEDAGNVILEDQFLLLDAMQQLPAQSVDGMALLVHHVVVFEDVFAGLEVLRLDRLLRDLDASRDQLRLDRDAFFHPQPLQQVRHPLLGEDAHQVVFEREVEAR